MSPPDGGLTRLLILPTAGEAVNGLKYANICFGVSGVLTLPRVRSLTADNQRIVPLTRRIPAKHALFGLSSFRFCKGRWVHAAAVRNFGFQRSRIHCCRL